MAKDSAQSRIPRLDGVTRIPVPGSLRTGINQKTHILMSTSKPIVASSTRPSSYGGVGNFRAPVSTIASLKKSLSGDKISEATKNTSNIMRKFLTKPSSVEIGNNKIVDDSVILDKEMKDDANQKLLISSDGGQYQQQQQQTHNIMRTLTRSETFVRDSNNESGSSILGLTHDIIPGVQPAQTAGDPQKTGISNNSSVFMTRTIDATSICENTVSIGSHPKQRNAFRNETTINATSAEGMNDADPHFRKTITNVEDSILKYVDLSTSFEDDTIVLAPDKSNMQLVLSSTINCDRLLDLTTMDISPKLMNITMELNESPQGQQNTTKLLYMTHEEMDRTLTAATGELDDHQAKLDDEVMEVDEDELPPNVAQMFNASQLQDLKMNKPRFSFGMDLTECTLDCSIELCDVSLGSSIPAQAGSPLLKKQNSFEMDESLGILTPDQMKEFLDSTTNNTNLDLPINMQPGGKLAMHQMRIDQTPSPEDLPLDPVGVKTEMGDVIMTQSITPGANTITSSYHQQELSQTDSYSKTDQMTKSNVSKVSNSFITSVTSITSLDGYQGDGEMSRPASRGAGDHSPSNGPRKSQLGRQPSFNQNPQPNIPIRRQDPMTDSDFFTESDADDIFHRGDRRAQVIDGQLYGPMLQPANVFITEQPQMEDSCMESSGIFTDVENRCDDDIVQSRREVDMDMSPDGSTDTVKSNNNDQQQPQRSASALSQGHSTNVLTDSQTSSTIQSSISSERMSISSIGGVVFGDYAQSKTLKSSTSALKSSQSTASVASGGGGGDGEITKTCSAAALNQANDDKKCTIAKKLQQTTVLPSVRKQSPSRKLLQYTSANVGVGKNESKTIASLKSKKSTPLTGLITATKTTLIGQPVDEDDCTNRGVDMLVKNTSIATSVTPKLRNSTNQENKRPVSGSASASNISGGVIVNNGNNHQFGNNGGNVIGGVIGNGSIANSSGSVVGSVRKVSPNKWDAVMNKIAENKVLKKNYTQVKSKVATGVLLRRSATPRLAKSPTEQSQDSNCGSINCGSGLSSPKTKRIIQGATKRGRSFSKDSQQSSQSDLSLSGGSSKLPTKASPSARSAKKRDVRTLSISPTDLGPPPKTQTNNGTARTKQQPVLSQKRLSPNIQQTTTTTTSSSPLLAGKQGSPPPKKVISRRPLVQQTHTKVPLKDHNRLAANTQPQNITGSPKSGIIHGGIKGSSNNSTTTTPGATSPALANCTATTLVCGGLKSTTTRTTLSQSPSAGVLHNNNSNNTNHTIVSPSSILQQNHKKQHQQIKSSKAAVDFHLVHANKGFEALGVLVQYLAYDLDAFSCPKVKTDYAQVKKCLLEVRDQLDEAKSSCHDLQDQLHEKDAYYTARESELQALHRCELEKVQTSLTDYEAIAKDRITSLEAELKSKDIANDQKLKDYMQQVEIQLFEKDHELDTAKDKEQELLKRISALSTTENELREKVHASEQSFANRLRDASQRERDLTEKVNCLNKELDVMRHQTENRERELEEKLNLSHDEISVLRHSRNSFDLSLSPKNSSPFSNGGAMTKLQMLQDEVESLRCVLELKQRELSDLRKQNQELKRASDELPSVHMKVSALESRIEDLQIQLKAKSEEEKDLLHRNKHLQDSYKQEVETRSRLSLHNEELQWRLKQNSEKFALTLNELSKSYNEQASFLNTSKMSLHSNETTQTSAEHLSSHNSSLASLNRTNGSDRIVGCFQMDDISPPTSPIIKGVVEKNDSVSWVLEMDDEAPEVLASRMVRRAGSFRSSFNEKSPNARRQYSLPTGTMASAGNPLTQSASATSVLRQHSSESVATLQPSTSTNSRIRSKSVTIKSSEPKKFVRQNSNGSGSGAIVNGTALSTVTAASWKEPICSSSPYTRHQRSSSSKQQQQLLVSPTSGSSGFSARPSSFCRDDDDDGLYRKPHERNLITCDTSALTSAENNRLELRSMPSHPSVQDLKSLKKCHEIQESAGEAMVSGTNSEDEGCSASSDDIVSSSSSNTSTTSSLGGVGSSKRGNAMSIEDALMDKISTSLGGTPMEVSWSDDVEQFQSESIV